MPPRLLPSRRRGHDGGLTIVSETARGCRPTLRRVLVSVFLVLGLGQLDGGVATPMPPELSSAAPWTHVETEKGVRLEKRAVKGSAFSEYRATMTVEVPVTDFCASVFDWGSYAAHDEVSVRRLLGERDDERIVYDQVQQPVVSDRDYAMTQRRSAADGVCRIRFWATNEHAPPLPKGFVRMEKMWGAWDFEATDAGTIVTYVLFSDPAGSIPSFLVHGAQKKSVLDTMRGALERARSGKRPPHP
jgi:hypothetical protein